MEKKESIGSINIKIDSFQPDDIIFDIFLANTYLFLISRYRIYMFDLMTLEHEFGIIMNLKKIRRLMKKYGLICPIRKANPYRRMAKAMATNNYHDNILNREFYTNTPGSHLLTDITYVFYGPNRDKAYLSTIKDSATREILAYKLSKTLDVDFVLETVKSLRFNN